MKRSITISWLLHVDWTISGMHLNDNRLLIKSHHNPNHRAIISVAISPVIPLLMLKQGFTQNFYATALYASGATKILPAR